MSHVANSAFEDTPDVSFRKLKLTSRALAVVAATFLGLTGCETMKSTMDSINIFDEDDKTETTVAETQLADASADPRKSAVVRAGVKPVDTRSVDEYMDQQEAMLREQLDGTGVTVTRMGEIIVLSMPGSATFASGSSEVESAFHPVLDSVAVVLDEFNQTYVDIVGHTDSKGSKEYNQRLSEKRAKSVARYLESNAVIGARVKADGMGEDEPIATNETREGRAMNRRVEIKLRPVT